MSNRTLRIAGKIAARQKRNPKLCTSGHHVGYPIHAERFEAAVGLWELWAGMAICSQCGSCVSLTDFDRRVS